MPSPPAEPNPAAPAASQSERGRGGREEGAHETVVLAVLGGIASGKSRVAARLAGPTGLVLSADALAHEALRDPEVVRAAVATFGRGVLSPPAPPLGGQSSPQGGLSAPATLDRAALAARVFDDPDARRQLEGWIHPRVRARIWAALEGARRARRPRVVLDVPLLLENDADHGLARASDFLVFVEAPAEERDRRAVHTRGWKPGEVARREATQLPLDEKRQRADVVVRNDGTTTELDAAIDAALAELGLG